MSGPGATVSMLKAGTAWPLSSPTPTTPVNGVTGVALGSSLTWTAANATSYDVKFGTTNPPPQVATAQASASYAPALAAADVGIAMGTGAAVALEKYALG